MDKQELKDHAWSALGGVGLAAGIAGLIGTIAGSPLAAVIAGLGAVAFKVADIYVGELRSVTTLISGWTSSFAAAAVLVGYNYDQPPKPQTVPTALSPQFSGVCKDATVKQQGNDLVVVIPQRGVSKDCTLKFVK